MSELKDKEYLVMVQCDLVKQHCSGYFCEKALNERSGGFAELDAGKRYRYIQITCGGCCGRALHRKLMHLVKKSAKSEGLSREKILVQFSSCICLENYHGPACPHLDYLRTMVAKSGLDLREGTKISKKAQEKRRSGIYKS
ncbi:MAG: CGGC domain-containing protein [Planctomycetes bacterium]|nr:CGGC domain-containing protein [Planctomycetota bacterium]